MKTFEQFYIEWYGYTLGVLKYKYNYKHNEIAEDLTQDVMIKVHKAITNGTYDGANDKGWLGFIINSTFIDEVRRVNRKGESTMATDDHDNYYDIKDVSEPIETTIIKEEWLELLDTCVDLLNPNFTDVVRQVILGNLKHKEYAELKGISINTSLGRARYAINALKKMVV